MRERRRPGLPPLALLLCLSALFGLIYQPATTEHAHVVASTPEHAYAGAVLAAAERPVPYEAAVEPAFIANHAQASPSVDQPGTMAAAPPSSDLEFLPPGRAPPYAVPATTAKGAPADGHGARAPPAPPGS